MTWYHGEMQDSEYSGIERELKARPGFKQLHVVIIITHLFGGVSFICPDATSAITSHTLSHILTHFSTHTTLHTTQTRQTPGTSIYSLAMVTTVVFL